MAYQEGNGVEIVSYISPVFNMCVFELDGASDCIEIALQDPYLRVVKAEKWLHIQRVA